jgi:hypothetical protein
MSLHFKRPEFGASLIRNLKSVDEKGFMKSCSNPNIVSEELMKEVVDRYAKFMFKEVEE